MGTASAKPAKLQAFVDAAAEIRGELQSRIAELRASYDSFQSSGGSYGVANPDLMDVELPNFVTNWANDETFVATVRQAFLDADTQLTASGVAEVDSVTFEAAFEAAAVRNGIDPAALLALREEVTVDDPVAAGIPRTSGFVADPVCTATGHFVESEDDFTWPDRLALLRWRRTYSSRFVAGGPFGRGWASWASVACVPQDDGAVGYVGPDGQLAVFAPVAGGYARVSGVAATMARPDGGAGWELRWDWASAHPGEVWAFDAGAGRLQSVTGPAVGTTTFVYEAGLLVALEHDGGRRLEIVWEDHRGAAGDGATGVGAGGNGSSSGLRIAAVRSSCGREARYRYDEAGDLVRTERVLGDRRYVPDGEGRIVEVWDADGVRLCRNTYDDQGRVLTQVSPFGRETVFRYEPGNRTVVSDTEDGPVTVYEHDRAGRLVALVDDEGHRMQRAFDARGRCVAATGFDGARTSQVFDLDGGGATRTRADGLTERFEYDDDERVVEHQVEGGPRLTFDYDGEGAFPTRMSATDGWEVRFDVADGLLRALTDADGVTVRFAHDADGNVVGSTNGVGAVTRTEPHVSGQAVRVTLPDGAEITCERDDAGRLLSMRTPVGDEFRLEWSPAGRLLAMVEPDGARTAFEHGSHGSVERIVDALGAAVELQHDQLERIVGMAAPGGAKWSFTYSAVGLLSLVDDPSGGTWSYDHDAEGRMVSATDPLGATVRQSYDAAGRVAEVVDRSGNATRYGRDALGRVVEQIAPGGAVTAYEWDDWGRPLSSRSPDGDVLTFTYTPAGRLRSVRTAEGRGRTASYDAAGRLASVTDASEATTRYEWDLRDRLVATVAPSGRRDTFTYDAAGRLVETERGGRRWRTEYDHRGRPLAVTDPLGNTSRYGYDLRGKLVSATDPLGATVRIAYDERGNPSTVTDALGGVVTTTYDAMRRPIATTDQLGRTLRIRRDAMGRTVRRELPTGQVVEWRRDARGLATDVLLDGREAVVFDRDAAGRPVVVHEPARDRTFRLGWTRGGRLASVDVDGRTTRWSRDGDGLVVARHDPVAGTTRFGRDAGGRLTAVSSDAWGRVDLALDAGGRLVGVRAAGLERRWDHDAGGLVVGYRESVEAGGARSTGGSPAGPSTAAVSRSRTMVRDDAGRLVEVSGDGGTVRYRYDAAGQLVGASGPAGAWTWAYDPAGRLVREDGPLGARTFAYDDAHQLVRIDGPGGTTGFTYDAAGRRTGSDGPGGPRTYTWDGNNRLVGFGAGGREHTLDVDALGRLAAVDGTPLVWDTSGPLAELLAVGDRRVVGAPGLPLGLAGPDGSTSWLAGGGFGARDPWGAALGDTGAAAAGPAGAGPAGTDPAGAGPAGAGPAGPALGFLGELDLGDGLTWLRNRVYDPGTRQFLSPDPLPGVPGLPVAAHPYHYANNDPVGFVDPLGLQPLSIDAYNEIREQETGVQWGNIAMVGLTAASFFVPGGPLIAMAVGAGIGMAPGIIQGVTTGNWDVAGIVKGGIVGGVAGRVGFAFGGASSTMAGALARGGVGGAASGSVGEVYDVLPLPGSDGQFNVENVALETVVGAGTGGMGHRFAAAGDVDIPTRAPDADGVPTQTVYRFYDPADPYALQSRLASADPATQQAENLRLQDPDYRAWRADQHMQGYVDNSPFVSVIDDPMGAVNSTDPWLRTIATGSPGDPGAARAPSIGRFEVPTDRLIPPDPGNKLSLEEGELLYQGDNLGDYHVETIDNPYPGGTPNWSS